MLKTFFNGVTEAVGIMFVLYVVWAFFGPDIVSEIRDMYQIMNCGFYIQ